MKLLLPAIALLISLNGFGQTARTTDKNGKERSAYGENCPTKGLHLFISYHVQNGKRWSIGNVVMHFDIIPSNKLLEEYLMKELIKDGVWDDPNSNVVILSITKFTPAECKRFDIAN